MKKDRKDSLKDWINKKGLKTQDGQNVIIKHHHLFTGQIGDMPFTYCWGEDGKHSSGERQLDIVFPKKRVKQ